MKSTNSNASGILFTLTFVGFVFVALIFLLVSDIEIGSMLEGKVNSMINQEVNSKVGSITNTVASGGSMNNSLFYEFGLGN